MQEKIEKRKLSSNTRKFSLIDELDFPYLKGSTGDRQKEFKKIHTKACQAEILGHQK